MSDFQTMDDFAVFVNDYLTPDRLKVQAYSYASDQQELSLLVTCCLDFFRVTPGLLSVCNGLG